MQILMNNKGFSLLGALMGMVIFVIGILAMIALQTQSLVSTGRATIRSTETTWGQDGLERVNSWLYDDPSLAAAVDPLEPVDSFPAGFHQETQGPYTITWVVFTSAQNGQNLNAYALIRDLPMFDGVNKTQLFQDLPVNAKLVLMHIAHPRENGESFVFVKSNT